MIDEAPRIRHQPVVRNHAALVALRGTPAGFIVDALGGLRVPAFLAKDRA